VPTSVATSQASHWPLQALSQQTASTQKPLAHWPGAAHVSPGPILAVQRPPEQKFPVGQSESRVQLPMHCVVPHVKGAQAWVCAAGQLPAPSQAAASVATSFEQLALRHEVLEPAYAHVAVSVPLHAPPQADPSVAQAGRVPCGAPLTGAHVPALLPPLQASH
jgi:hypothetical protein